MNNQKLDLHKKLLREALSILDNQERTEYIFSYDPDYCKSKEIECIELYAAKLAGINQLTFEQLSNAKVIGDLKVDNNGQVHPLFNEILANHFTPVS